MSTQPLDKKLRKQLENTIIKARNVAEAAARTALVRLCVGDSKPGVHLTEELRRQRNKLRAHGRQIGDIKNDKDEQTIGHLVQETAYEQWHRMLFARFLAENSLLIYEDGVTPLSIQECFELAEDENGVNGWELAGRYASVMLPQIFRPENPVLTISFSPEHQRELEKLLEGLDAETFRASDSLGWVYQHWQTQKKEEVNKSGNKIGADELSAVTQLFTEPYMVSFLLDNSLGAWWAARRLSETDLKNTSTEEELRKKAAIPGVPLEYLRYAKIASSLVGEGEGEIWTPAAGTFESWPVHLSALKTLDPCCGSGHFLVAAFLMLVPMRMELENLTAREAVDHVITENLHGLELDQRCVELAAFALALTAWRYPNSGGYRTLPELNVACSGLTISAKKEDWLTLAGDNTNLRLALEELYKQFKDASVLGSLINPEASLGKGSIFELNWEEVSPLLAKALSSEKNDERAEMGIVASGIVKAADLLSGKYHWVITNVPYLSLAKQEDRFRDYCLERFPDAGQDLSTVFLLRLLELCNASGTTGVVIPQNWLTQKSYAPLRKLLLTSTDWRLVAKLGAKGFSTPMWDFNVQLLILTKRGKSTIFSDKIVCSTDVAGSKGAEEKSIALKDSKLSCIKQMSQIENENCSITFVGKSNIPSLDKWCVALFGSGAGDKFRFTRYIWEVALYNRDIWELHQTTPPSTLSFSGRDEIILWEKECGQMCGLAESVKHLNHKAQQWRSGKPNWGKKGVIVSLMANLPATLYTGEIYAAKCTALVPINQNEEFLAALWAFCSSSEFTATVRELNPRLAIEVKELLQVPFEYERWKNEAKKQFPNGLPKPYSADPTQWLFHGHPAQAEEPLQVAVARLLGYQWPAESDSGMELSEQARQWIARCESLSSYVDDDGIVCLSPVRGEKSAAERLEALLMAAFGEHWNASLRNKLLSEVNCKGKSLDFWLREKFFEQHCKLFQDRPFIWHIWDGLADGFSALVNYHQLNRQNLERLIYTYLGDWIRTQDHGVKEGVDGALLRLQAAQTLKNHLETILEGEAPYDIFVRWKSLAEQPLGWNPDINDGVRMNIRPFMVVPDVGKKEAGILRTKPNIKWTKDRGNDVASAPWYKLGLQYNESEGSRINDHHLTLAEKQAARDA